MSETTEQHITHIQTMLKEMGYQDIPEAKDILGNDISDLIDYLIKQQYKMRGTHKRAPKKAE